MNPDYLPTGDPPARSETVYESTLSGGLQDALDALEPDTRLVLDDGPYVGNFDLPHTSRVTVDGDGTTLERSDVDEELLENQRTGDEYGTNVDGVGTYAAGQSSIEVADASIFSVGDIVRIYDDTQVHPDLPGSGTGDDSQGMYHVVTAADAGADELTLDEDLFLDWDNPNGDLRVDLVEWGAEDVRITGIAFEATPNPARGHGFWASGG